MTALVSKCSVALKQSPWQGEVWVATWIWGSAWGGCSLWRQRIGRHSRVTESDLMSFQAPVWQVGAQKICSSPLVRPKPSNTFGCCNKAETCSTGDYSWQRIQRPREKVGRRKVLSLLFAEDKGCKLCAIRVTFSSSGFLGSSPCAKALEIILQWKKMHINNPKSFPAETQTTTITLRCEFFLLPWKTELYTENKKKILFLYHACESKGACPGSREVFIVTQYSICTGWALQWWCQTAGTDLAWTAQGRAGEQQVWFGILSYLLCAEGALGVACSMQCCFWCLICFCSRWEGFYSCEMAFSTDGKIRDFVSADFSLREGLAFPTELHLECAKPTAPSHPQKSACC